MSQAVVDLCIAPTVLIVNGTAKEDTSDQQSAASMNFLPLRFGS